MQAYLCTRNSDLTEGRGVTVTFAIAFDLAVAVRTVTGASTQGSDGSVYAFQFTDDDDDQPMATGVIRIPEPNQYSNLPMLYGYHRDAAGNYVTGYTDNRHLTANPRFAQYAELMAEFEPKRAVELGIVKAAAQTQRQSAQPTGPAQS